MPDIPFFWIVVVGAVIFSAIAGVAQRAQARRARAEWAAAAERLGLSVSGNNIKTLRLAGGEGEIRVVVDLVRSDNSTTTRYRIRVPPIGVDLGLSKQSDWHQFTRAFGAQDLEIGEPDFDERFMVKTKSPEKARDYLTPTRVAALNSLADQHPGMSFFDATLILSTGGVAKPADRIVTTVNDLLKAARTLVPEVAPERDEELQRIVETINEYSDDRTADSPSQEASEEPASDMVAAATGQSAAVVAERLFGDRQLGFEVERRFDDEYRNTMVDWRGTVQRHAGISAERKFEGEGHSIIEVNVATIEDDLYGTTSVDAVVAFPGGTTIPERGETVRFSGRLIAIDALTKDVYVADASIDPG